MNKHPPTAVLVAYEFSTRIMGGSARAIQFARHLPEFGWNVHVITATPASELPETPSGVTVTSIASAERKFGGGIAVDADGDGSLGGNPWWLRAASSLKRIAPFERQLTWCGPFRRRTRGLFNNEPPAVVISSGPPYVVIGIGDALARRLGIPHVIDLRDDWRDRFAIEPRSRLNRYLLERYAVRLLTRAAGVTVVSPVTRERFEADYGVSAQVVMNGFVESHFQDTPYTPVPVSPDGPLRIVHLGWMGEFRSVEPLLNAMRALQPSTPIRFEQYGLIEDAQRRLIEASGLEGSVSIGSHLPHADAIQLMLSADVLLAIPGTRIPAALTGKLFEYLRARRPILLIATDGAAKSLAHDVGIRWCVDPNDADGLIDALTEIAKLKSTGELVTSTRNDLVAQLERRHGVLKLAQLIDACARPRSKRTN